MAKTIVVSNDFVALLSMDARDQPTVLQSGTKRLI